MRNSELMHTKVYLILIHYEDMYLMFKQKERATPGNQWASSRPFPVLTSSPLKKQNKTKMEPKLSVLRI